VCNAYTEVYNRNQSHSNSFTENIDQQWMPFYTKRNAAEQRQFFSLPSKSLMSDEYNSSSDMLPGETFQEREFQHEINEYFHPNGSGSDYNVTYITPDIIPCVEAPAYIRSCSEVENRCAGLSRRYHHFEHQLSMELTADEYKRLMVPSSRNMCSLPPSPIFKTLPSTAGDVSADHF